MTFISKIKAGDFNQKIRLNTVTSQKDAFGGVNESPSTFFLVWANKNVKTLRDIEEKFEGEELQSYGRFVYTIRYSENTKNIKANWTINDHETGERYEILGFVIDPRKEFIEIFVKQDLPTQSHF
jgi:head-tail adaptor